MDECKYHLRPKAISIMSITVVLISEKFFFMKRIMSGSLIYFFYVTTRIVFVWAIS